MFIIFVFLIFMQLSLSCGNTSRDLNPAGPNRIGHLGAVSRRFPAGYCPFHAGQNVTIKPAVGHILLELDDKTDRCRGNRFGHIIA